MNALQQHNEAEAQARTKAQEATKDMSRERLLEVQEICRARYKREGATHDLVAMLEVINERLQAEFLV